MHIQEICKIFNNRISGQIYIYVNLYVIYVHLYLHICKFVEFVGQICRILFTETISGTTTGYYVPQLDMYDMW